MGSSNSTEDYSSIHYSQKNSWDCGTACIYMVYSWVGEKYFPSKDIVDKSSPLWTIEIFKELMMLNLIDLEFYTLSLGVEPHHFEISWYESNLKYELDYIADLFSQSKLFGWPIYKVMLFYQ